MNINFGLCETLTIAGCFIYTSNFWLGVTIIAVASIAGVLRYGIDLNNRAEVLKLEEKKMNYSNDILVASGALGGYVGSDQLQ